MSTRYILLAFSAGKNWKKFFIITIHERHDDEDTLIMRQDPGQQALTNRFASPPTPTDFNESRAAGMIPRPPLSDSCQRRISAIDWISCFIVHDLRNPLGTVSAGAEMLMELDSLPSQAKRLAANIFRAASRMRELLGDLAEANCGNKPTFAICKI